MPTSSKKSKPAPRKTTKAIAKRKPKHPSFESLGEIAETFHEQQISELQQDLAKEKDGRLEERFWLGFLASFLGLCALSSTITAPMWAWVAPLYIGVLILAAQKCGVDEVVVLLSSIYSRFVEKK